MRPFVYLLWAELTHTNRCVPNKTKDAILISLILLICFNTNIAKLSFPHKLSM